MAAVSRQLSAARASSTASCAESASRLAAMLAEHRLRPASLHRGARAVRLRARRHGRGRDHRIRRNASATSSPAPRSSRWAAASCWPQQALLPGLTLAGCRMRRVMPSDRALVERRPQGGQPHPGRCRPAADPDPGRLAQRLRRGRMRCSGCRPPSDWPRGRSSILQRREPRIFYPDRNAALDDLYDVEPGDICPRTQRVNRMGGLRGLRSRDVAPDRAPSADTARAAGRRRADAAVLRHPSCTFADAKGRRWSCPASAIAR